MFLCSETDGTEHSIAFVDICYITTAVFAIALNNFYCYRGCLKFLFFHSGGSSTPILFYRRDEPYFEFTNFAEYPIVVDGLQYPTSEHYFQSQKLIGTPFVAHICQLPTARQAFEFPRQPHVSPWTRRDWQTVKEDVMYRALVAKFQQHRELQFMLLSTGDRKLVEHSPYDSYWGDGPDGKGLNRLGELLMRVRELLVFVRDHGEHILSADHINVSPTSDSSSQHLSEHCANSSSPVRQHVEADGDSASPASDSDHVPSNDGVCHSSIPEGNIRADKCPSPQGADKHTSSQSGNNHCKLSNDYGDCNWECSSVTS